MLQHGHFDGNCSTNLCVSYMVRKQKVEDIRSSERSLNQGKQWYMYVARVLDYYSIVDSWIMIVFFTTSYTPFYLSHFQSATRASSVHNYIGLFYITPQSVHKNVNYMSFIIVIIFDHLCCNIDHHKTIYWTEISETYVRTMRVKELYFIRCYNTFELIASIYYKNMNTCHKINIQNLQETA